jgi:hypothetical protein
MDDSPEKCPSPFKWNALHPPPLHGKQRHSFHSNNGQQQQQPTIVPLMSDEENKELQFQFFQQLAHHFSMIPRTSMSLILSTNDGGNHAIDEEKEASQSMLFDFLEQMPMIQHMGWRE